MRQRGEAAGLPSQSSLSPAPQRENRRRSSRGALGIFAYAVLSIAIALLAAYAITTSDDAPVILALFMLVVAVVLFRCVERALFMLVFAANIVALLGIANYYVATTGQPFNGGGDEFTFFSAASDIGRSILAGRWSAVSAYAHYSGYGFILVGGVLYALLAPLAQFSPLTIRIANACVGATIGPAVYRVGKSQCGSSHRGLALSAAVAAGLFPMLIAYAGSGLRDIWLAAATTWVVALTVTGRTGPATERWKRYATVGALLVAILFFRPESLAPVLVFVAVWLYLKARRPMRLILFGAATVALFGIAGRAKALVQYYDDQRIAYTQLALDQAGGGSLGARILRLPHPANELARFGYAAFAPVPPSFAGGPDQWLVGLGAILWYFVIPFALSGLALAWRTSGSIANVARAAAASSVVLLGSVALTSLDVRHKTVVLPLLILFATYGWYRLSRRQAAQYIGASVLVYGLLFVAYLGIKGA